MATSGAVKKGFISDADMANLESNQPSSRQPQSAKPKFISDMDMASMEKSEPERFGSLESEAGDIGRKAVRAVERSVGDKIINGVATVASAVDSVTGAPTRSAIAAIQDGKNPLTAAWDQFAEDPSTAPTGKDIALKAGIPDKTMVEFTGEQAAKLVGKILPGVEAASYFMPDESKNRVYKPTFADAAGVAVDAAADPTNLIGIGEARSAAKGLGVAADVAKSAARAVPGVKATEEAVKTVGTVARAGSETVSNAANAIKKMFSPTQAADFGELTQIAAKNNIDSSLLPEAIEFGQDSFISRSARKTAEGPLGEAALTKFNQGLDAVRDATEGRIAKMSGGSVPSKIEAGEIIRSGYDQGVDNLFNGLDVTHNRIMEAIPGLQVSPDSLAKIDSKLNGIEKFAKGRNQRGFTNTHRGQGEQLMRAIEAVRAGSGSYKQTVETLRDIGDVAFKSKNIYADIPPDIEKFQDLYHTIKDALMDTVSQAAGPEVAKELQRSNEIISQFYGNKSKLAHIIGNKNMAPERVFTALVEHGDSSKIQALKEILPPETFNQLKGAFLESQIKRTAADGFTFRSLHNNLRNKKNILEHLLDGQEIDDLNELIRLGDRFGDPILSKSGTGASMAFTDIGKTIGDDSQNRALVDVLKDSARKRGSAKPIEREVEEIAETASSATKPAGGVERPSVAKRRAKDIAVAAAAPTVASAATASKIGSSQVNQKGPDKWANDGAVVLQQHDNSLSPDLLEKAKKSPRLRELLFRASTLKPGSKQLNQIAEEIRAEGQVQ